MTETHSLSREAIDRCLNCAQMRRDGMTYRAIGYELKVSGQHAKVLVSKGKEYERVGIDALLSVRARNITLSVVGLVGGMYPTPHYIESNRYHPLEFLRVPGCGRQTFDEIVTWMNMHGCWKAYDHLGREKKKPKPKPADRRRRPASRLAERNWKIFLRRLDTGDSYKKIGEDYGISGPRVRQIVDWHVRTLAKALRSPLI